MRRWGKALFVTALLLPIILSASRNVATAQTAQPSQPLLKAEELDQLVAPIALYPDTLLSEVLMASTYPLEVVQADRWAKQNANLKGDQLKAAVDKQGWDQSLKSLAATPSVLDMMSTKLDWTQKLGDAVLAQQADVMDAVQRLRAKAEANNQLKTTSQQKVTKATNQSKQYIVIEPAVPNTVYVPYYNPAVVYGGWPYPAYPPYYFPAPGYIAGAAIATGIAFGVGYAVGRWASGGGYWGGGFNWGNNNININNIGNNNNWRHNPDHRHGVQYHNDNVRQKFANNNARGNAQNRIDFRGRDGKQVLKPGGDRPNAGNLPGGKDRPNAGNRPSGKDRPNASRPGKGGGGEAFKNMDRRDSVQKQSNRGSASMRGRSPEQFQARGGGGRNFGGGGGGRRAGGRGGGRRR